MDKPKEVPITFMRIDVTELNGIRQMQMKAREMCLKYKADVEFKFKEATYRFFYKTEKAKQQQ